MVIAVVDVGEIDRRVQVGELNQLEREHAARIIDRSPGAERIIADGRTLFSPLAQRYPHLDARDRAEEFHVAVAAASIVAKVRRDELFSCIVQRYQAEFGSIAGGGYHNEATLGFLRAYVTKHGRLPPEARRSFRISGLADCLPAGYQPLADLAGAGKRLLP